MKEISPELLARIQHFLADLVRATGKIDVRFIPDVDGGSDRVVLLKRREEVSKDLLARGSRCYWGGLSGSYEIDPAMYEDAQVNLQEINKLTEEKKVLDFLLDPEPASPQVQK